jgi:hypothetical protein
MILNFNFFVVQSSGERDRPEQRTSPLSHISMAKVQTWRYDAPQVIPGIQNDGCF